MIALMQRLGRLGTFIRCALALSVSGIAWPAQSVTPEDLAEALGSVAHQFDNIVIRTGYTSTSNIWIPDILIVDPDESDLPWYTDTTYEDRLAAGPGRESGSLLLSTGRVEDEGMGDTAFGGPGSDLLDLTLFSVNIQDPPQSAKYLVFTTRFITSEYDGTGTERNDYAVMGVRDWGDAHSVQFDTLADVYSASSSQGPEVIHAVPVGDIGGAVSTRSLIFGVFDADDGAGDSGLLVSDMHFTSEEMNPPGSPAEFLPPPPHVNLSSGTYSYNREVLHVPGVGLPLTFSLHYGSSQTRSGCFGRKWRHGYDWYIREQGAQMIVYRGDGGRDYFRRNNGGYDAEYGATTKLQKFGEEFIYTTKEQTRYRFDGEWRLSRITDRNDNAVSFHYDGEGRLVRIDDTRENSAEFAYDGNRCIRISYPGLPPIEFEYDERYDSEYGDLSMITELCGNTIGFTYDEHGNLLTGTRNHSVEFINNRYWPFRQLLRTQTDARGQQTRFGYGTDTLWTTTPMGHASYRVFDEFDRLIVEADGNGNTRRVEYDENNNINRETGPRGHVWTMEYDANHNLTSKRNPLGQTITKIYDDWNNLTSETDESGATTEYNYDAAGNLISQIDPMGHTIRYQYNAWGQVEVITDARGTQAEYEYYEGAGDISSVTVARTARTSFTYDALGNRTSMTDPNGNTTTYEYDETGTLIAEVDALGGRTSYAYDSDGRLLAVTDPAGATTRYEYDDNGNQIRIIDALGRQRERVYDADNRLTDLVDPLGRMTSFLYDPAGRMVGVRDEQGRFITATYDASGNPASVTDANGKRSTFAHDALDRIVRVTDPEGRIETYEYTPQGDLQRASNGRRIVEYADDAARRMIGVAGTRLGDGATETVSYGLDANGNRISSAIGHRHVTREFDTENRVKSRSDEFGNTIGYVYDAAGNLTALTYSDGKQVEYEYDAVNRLTAVTDWSGHRAEYTYDPAGKVTQALLPDESVVTYAHDLAGRPTEVRDANRQGQTIYHARYTWNAADLLTREDVKSSLPEILGERDVAFTYDGSNALATGGEEGLYEDTFSHDASGNLTEWRRDGESYRQYEYDAFDRLTVYRTNDFIYTHVYDADGIRVATHVDLPSGSRVNTVRYVYDPSVSPPRLLEEQNANGRILARYVHGIGLISRESESGHLSTYHFDSRGSTVALTDASGNITDRYAYGPYGSIVGNEGDTPNPFTFVGRNGVVHDGNELYFAQARYYSPEMMRFIQADLQKGSLAYPKMLNRYAYAEGNPIGLIDPEGETGLEILIMAIIGAVLSVGVQVAADAISVSKGGEWSSWGTYIGAAVTGLILGGVAAPLGAAGQSLSFAQKLAIGVAVGAGAAAVGNMTEQVLNTWVTRNQGGINWGNFGISVGVGAAAGAMATGTKVAVDKIAKKTILKCLGPGGAKLLKFRVPRLETSRVYKRGLDTVGIFTGRMFTVTVKSLIPPAPESLRPVPVDPNPPEPSPRPVNGGLGYVPPVQVLQGNCCGR